VDEPPLGPVVSPAAATGVLGELAGVFPTGRGALPRASVMSNSVMSIAKAASEGSTPPTTLADPVPCAVGGPFVPSKRGGAFGSEAPSSTSGSTSSAEANSVGMRPESEGAAGTSVLEGCEAEADEAEGGASGPSSSAPYASKSSSESIRPFDGAVCGDALAEEGAAAEEDGRAPPTWDAVPFTPKGSSTGRSAKGSKAGREAASIVFEPESGDEPETYPAMPLPTHLGAGSQIGAPSLGS
jgi:hypothetical protein